MRVVFFVLLAMNLVYLAWAGWVDKPALPPVAARPSSSLPELALAAPPAEADQVKLASREPETPVTPAVAASTPAGRCVSVGPFNDLARAARAAALLRDRGFNPRQRAEQGDPWEGYWVYVADLKSASDEAKVMTALKRAGISDASVMPEGNEGRRISVGLFSEKDRADKRAAAVKRLGIAAQVAERKQPGTVYWVDLELGAREGTVPTEGLLSGEEAGSRLEIRVCPVSEAMPSPAPRSAPLPRDARPASTTADAGFSRPG